MFLFFTLQAQQKTSRINPEYTVHCNQRGHGSIFSELRQCWGTLPSMTPRPPCRTTWRARNASSRSCVLVARWWLMVHQRCTEDVWHQTHSNLLSLFQGSALVALIQAFYFNLKNAQTLRQSIGPVNSTWPWYRWTEAGQVDLSISWSVNWSARENIQRLFVRSWYDNEWGYSNRLLATLKGSTCSPKSENYLQ